MTIQEWSSFFFWKLVENQYNFAKRMNIKTKGKFCMVLKCWRSKQILPIYQDLALWKIVEQDYHITIPKATISTRLDRVPELLQSEEILKELLEDQYSKKIVKDEKKYTKEEWEYIHRLEWEKINIEYRTMMAKLADSSLSDSELMKITWASRRLMNKINNYWLTMKDTENQDEFILLNEKIMKRGRERILNEIDTLEVASMQDLKNMSSIVSEVFKQNQLIQGKSTENIGHGITDIYEAILKKAEWVKEIETWENQTLIIPEEQKKSPLPK